MVKIAKILGKMGQNSTCETFDFLPRRMAIEAHF
jgi:hypothetical protein